jgi:cell division protein FtsW
MRSATLRGTEGISLFLILVIAVSGFACASIALALRQGTDPLAGLGQAVLLPVLAVLPLIGIHILLRLRRVQTEQLLLPVVALILVLGLTMIWRLRGAAGAWQQLRSVWLGAGLIAVLVARPAWIEQIRRRAIPICLAGLALALLTAGLGRLDESGARLSLKLGPLPAIQTTELIKIALIFFLAWFAEEEGRAVEGRSQLLMGWLRLPPLRYFIPGASFVAVATLALVRMADYGAVLILICLFVGILFTAFETRTFLTLLGIGAALAALAALVLVFTWHIPDVVRYRYLAFLDPWSSAPYMIAGAPTGLTIAQGPGYQIQQSIYAVLSGGLTGTGLGFGSPGLVPLAFSDFIFAAIVEEMGMVIGVAALGLFGVLFMRLFRLAALLPENQVFERVLVAGIGIHLLAQVVVMVGGTLDLLPMTGVTLPFLSLGGTALAVNLVEVGLALALVQRVEARPV